MGDNETMRVQASSEEGVASTASVLAKPTVDLVVPIRELTDIESICTGFRAECISVGPGGVDTHGGMGSGFAVSMRWKDRQATIVAQELLAAWVRTFDPAAADAIAQAGKAPEPAADRRKSRKR